jgi:hypothetical protein
MYPETSLFGMSAERAALINRVRVVIVGEDDPRVRATWRVLLAMPILWVLTGAVLTGNIQATVDVIPSGESLGSGLASSVLHGGFFLVALSIWARVLDWQPLSNYGVSVSTDWGRAFLGGFLAVVVGQLMWLGVSSLSGGKSIHVAPSAPNESLLVWLVLPFAALVLHAAVQQIVFFRVILKTAAEGLHSWGVSGGTAALVAIPVATVLFIAMHGSTTPLRILDLAVAGVIFGLLYVHSGDLGLGIGAHFGAFFSGTVVFAVVEVSGSLSETLGVIDGYGFPKMVAAYLVVLLWLGWQHGGIPVQNSIVRSSVS